MSEPTAIEVAAKDRHPSTQHLARFFSVAHLPLRLQLVAQPCAALAARRPRLSERLRCLGGKADLASAPVLFVGGRGVRSDGSPGAGARAR